MGQSTLGYGMGTFITFTGRSSCVMDFKLVFEDGETKTDENGMDVCQLAAVLFTDDTAVGLPLPR